MTSESERIIDLYERHAQEWIADRGNVLFEGQWLNRFLSLIPESGSILDVGCGSGEPIARYLIQSGRRVTGVDSSPTLIDHCRRRFPDCEWLVADMRRLDLPTRFNGILAWDSFFHLCPGDQAAMFPILRKLALPGAVLMYTSGPSHGEAIGSYHGEPLYHGSLSSEEYREQLQRYGFEVIAHIVEDPECGHHTIWLAQLKSGE